MSMKNKNLTTEKLKHFLNFFGKTKQNKTTTTTKKKLHAKFVVLKDNF